MRSFHRRNSPSLPRTKKRSSMASSMRLVYSWYCSSARWLFSLRHVPLNRTPVLNLAVVTACHALVVFSGVTIPNTTTAVQRASAISGAEAEPRPRGGEPDDEALRTDLRGRGEGARSIAAWSVLTTALSDKRRCTNSPCFFTAATANDGKGPGRHARDDRFAKT